MPGSSFGILLWITSYPRLCNGHAIYVAEFRAGLCDYGGGPLNSTNLLVYYIYEQVCSI